MTELRAKRRDASTIVALVAAAREGDEAAWNELVDEFGGLVWSIARAYRLSATDAADVSQTTWLRLAEYVGRLREPERVGAWLAATARNECLRLVRCLEREHPLGDDLPESVSLAVPPEDRLVRVERATVLWSAFAELSERCRLLLRALMADPLPSYEDVGAALEMPVGSIGPTRARCLENLRRLVVRRGINAGAGDS